MNRYRYMVAVLVMFGISTANPIPLGATGARSESLVGSWAFEDVEDVHTFPSLLVKWGTAIYLDSLDWSTGENARRGDTSGGVIIGKTTALGVFVNRPTVMNRFAQFGVTMTQFSLLGNIFPNDAVVAGEIFNLGLSTKLANKHSLGFALRLLGFSRTAPGAPGDGFQQQGNLTAAAAPPFLQKYFGPGVTVAYSTRTFDVALNGLYAWHGNSRNDPRGNTVITGVTARYIRPMRNWWDLVFAANVNVFMYKQKGDVYRSVFSAAIPLQAGGRMLLSDKKLRIAAMGGVAMEVGQWSGDNTQTQFSVVSPSAELAAEYAIFKWLKARLGLKHSWGIWIEGRDPNELPPGDNRRPTFERSDFRTGFGLHYKNFGFDGVIEYQFYKNGPDMIGGAGNGLFSGFSIFLRQ